MGVACRTGVGVTGDVTKDTGERIAPLERPDLLTDVTGEVTRGCTGRDTVGDCFSDAVGVDGETTVFTT